MPDSPRTIPGPTPGSPTVALATLAEVTGSNDQTGEPVTVHFNPVSLQLAVSNELKDTTNNERKQYIAKTSAKLTMDLIFDTTDTGDDVTLTTRKIQAFLIPPAPSGQRANPQKPPPLVMFEWGTIRFKGIAEAYKETLDFFSANGVPLRAAVNLTLSRQDQVFDEPSANAPQNGTAAGDDTIFDAPAKSAAETANTLQNPGAARALAAANGQESVRFNSGNSLAVSEKPNSASFFPSGGAPVSVSPRGTIPELGAGFLDRPQSGAGDQEEYVIPPTGVANLAKLSASEGAFSGLSISKSSISTNLKPSKLIQKASTESIPIGATARFEVGGKAKSAGSNGLCADVGANKLTFD